jgi:hypothetical protein
VHRIIASDEHVINIKEQNCPSREDVIEIQGILGFFARPGQDSRASLAKTRNQKQVVWFSPFSSP